MKVLFFTKGDKSTASSRFRVWYVARRLKEQFGYEYEVIHSIGYSFWKPALKRFRILRELTQKIKERDSEIIFIHKSLFPLDYILLTVFLKKMYGKKMIYDLDDAEWLHSKFKSRLLAKNADMIFCGSHEIFNWAKKYNKNLEIIPTVVDHALYLPFAAEHKEKNEYTLCWQGEGPGHFRDGHINTLKDILDGLYERKAFKFRFLFIGSRNSAEIKALFKDAPYQVIFVDSVDWASDPVAVPRVMKEFEADFGFNPLKDSPWNRAKCSFKALEYMAAGIPVAQSAVGENSFVTKDGENGVLFYSVGEAIDRTLRVFSSTEIRKKMGEAALRTVKDGYSFEAVIPKIKRILQSWEDEKNS